jgi:hypothetical protein
MFVEKMTGQNFFAVFGGVPAITPVRDGVLRCMGPFGHPILAGTVGAALLPLFVALWWQGSGNRLQALLGIASSSIIVAVSGSSGPVMTCTAALVGLAMWPMRRHMRLVRWGILLVLVGLHLVMKAPVWFLIARANVFSASTGFHRALLIDLAIRHFGEWWLVGTKLYPEWDLGMFDVTNEFVWNAVNGGLITLLLFVGIIALCFRAIGRAIQALEGEPRKVQVYLWAMGASLFSHVITFISVQYFDQTIVIWYLLLAMISVADMWARRSAPEASKNGLRWRAPQAEHIASPSLLQTK